MVGDLVEDIVVWFDGALRPADDNPARIVRTRGGSAANVAAFAARLGTPARFIGRVGADPLGAQLVATLDSAGVDVRVQRQGVTGTIVVLVDPAGERTMFPDRGAAAELADVPSEWLDGLDALHVTSYSFATEPAAGATLELLATARRAGLLVSLDASSSGLLLDLGVARYVGLVQRARPAILFANAAEARLLDLEGPPFSGMVTIVKHGSDPTIVRAPDGARLALPVAAVEQVRDATGAGDAFAAGFLSAHLAGEDLAAAVHRGHALAREVLGSPGAGLGPPVPGARAAPAPCPPDPTLQEPTAR
ncbi:MAG TPA: PfkB family carbohydrate kinase [Solirubrobacteraceae bacterium]|nr:PfkB family carbohydrate kinase [Solirubrobacteraceae bacterium]